MIPDVIPISTTLVDWKALSAYLGNFVTRSIARELDCFGVKSETLESYIQTLDLFGNSNSQPKDSLKFKFNNIHESVSFGFLIRATPNVLSELMKYVQIPFIISIEGDCAVWTQTIGQWFLTLIKNYSQATYDTIIILNKIFFFFEQIGFKNVWWGYGKRPATAGDKLFYLEAIQI